MIAEPAIRGRRQVSASAAKTYPRYQGKDDVGKTVTLVGCQGGRGAVSPNAGECTSGCGQLHKGPSDSHFLRVHTDSACKTALALPCPTAAPTAALAPQSHHC